MLAGWQTILFWSGNPKTLLNLIYWSIIQRLTKYNRLPRETENLLGQSRAIVTWIITQPYSSRGLSPKCNKVYVSKRRFSVFRSTVQRNTYVTCLSRHVMFAILRSRKGCQETKTPFPSMLRECNDALSLDECLSLSFATPVLFKSLWLRLEAVLSFLGAWGDDMESTSQEEIR